MWYTLSIVTDNMKWRRSLMFKLIIADDEPIILKTMEKRFDWQSMGYELMALCNDGDAVID